jgi:hypothetical protein
MLIPAACSLDAAPLPWVRQDKLELFIDLKGDALVIPTLLVLGAVIHRDDVARFPVSMKSSWV